MSRWIVVGKELSLLGLTLLKLWPHLDGNVVWIDVDNLLLPEGIEDIAFSVDTSSGIGSFDFFRIFLDKLEEIDLECVKQLLQLIRLARLPGYNGNEMADIKRWKKKHIDRLYFWEPSSRQRADLIEDTGNLPCDTSVMEIVIFGILCSSLSFHNAVGSNHGINLIMKSWFQGFLSCFNPRRNVISKANMEELGFKAFIVSYSEVDRFPFLRSSMADKIKILLPAYICQACDEDEWDRKLKWESNFQEVKSFRFRYTNTHLKISVTAARIRREFYTPASYCTDFSKKSGLEILKLIVAGWTTDHPFEDIFELLRNKKLDAAAKYIKDSSGRLDDSSGRLDDSSGRLDDSSGRLDNSSGRLDDSSGRLDDSSGRLDDSSGRSDVVNWDLIRCPTTKCGLMHLAASLCLKPNQWFKTVAGVNLDLPTPANPEKNGLCQGVRFMRMLNENLGCSYNVVDSEGKNVLFYAYDCQDCLDFLASQGCPWDIYDCQRRSLFYFSASMGSLIGCKWSHSRGSAGNDRSILDRTALCKAAWGNHTNLVSYLINVLGLDPNPVDSKLRTPLHSAVWGPAGGKSGVKMIGDRASSESFSSAFELLRTKRGRDSIRMTDIDGCTPLHILASTDGFQCALLLIRADGNLVQPLVDLKTTNRIGWTPLMCASYRGNIELIESLLRCNGKLDLCDNTGHDAMHYAIKGGNVNSVKVLRNWDQLRRRNHESKSINQIPLPSHYLYLACIQSQFEVIDWLLNNCKWIESEFYNIEVSKFLEDDNLETATWYGCSLYHLVILGQKRLPVNRDLFESLPFPPFKPQQDRVISTRKVFPFVDWLEEIKWRRTREIIGGRIIVSTAMISSLATLISNLGAKSLCGCALDIYFLLVQAILQENNFVSRDALENFGASLETSPYYTEPDQLIRFKKSNDYKETKINRTRRTNQHETSMIIPKLVVRSQRRLSCTELERLKNILNCPTDYMDQFLSKFLETVASNASVKDRFLIRELIWLSIVLWSNDENQLYPQVQNTVYRFGAYETGETVGDFATAFPQSDNSVLENSWFKKILDCQDLIPSLPLLLRACIRRDINLIAWVVCDLGISKTQLLATSILHSDFQKHPCLMKLYNALNPEIMGSEEIIEWDFAALMALFGHSTARIVENGLKVKFSSSSCSRSNLASRVAAASRDFELIKVFEKKTNIY